MQKWEHHEPSPIEFMHAEIMDEFHKYRVKRGSDVNVEMNGIHMTNIIAKAKEKTYKKYSNLGLDKPILKKSLK